MALKDQLYVSGVWTDSDILATNDTGTPLVSAVLSLTGEEISDTYTLTVSARAGGTGTITINADSPNNPYDGKVVAGVNFDDTTAYSNVVPGVTIVFDNAAVNGDVASITIGSPYGSFDASGVGAGVPTAGVRHRVENTGTSDVTDCKAQLLTQAIEVHITNKAFQYIRHFADGAVEKIAGGGSDRVMPYALTISAVSGSGPTKVATLSVDGVALGAASVFDLTTGTAVSGAGLKAVTPAYPYKILTGPLAGLEFALDADVANGDKSNVMIFESRFIQIAPDASGVEGTYGTTDVDLTEAGQATGVITASGVAYYWTRFLVPASSNNESNPYPCMVALSASQSTSAGWEE